jgi:uncharacterized protein (TIGR02284 family)
MDNDKAIATLNHLIETCKDGEQGFRTAAEGVKNAQTRSLFLEFAQQRADMARELQQEVRTLGGDPEQSGTLSGSAHRGWMNIKSAVTRDDKSIIAEAERGEDIAKQAYEEALGSGLPPTTLAIVRQQAARVRDAHDRVRAMEKAGSVS